MGEGDPDLFDERLVATETKTADFWLELTSHLGSPSPSVESYVFRGAELADVTRWIESRVDQSAVRARIYLLLPAGPGAADGPHQFHGLLLMSS
ncbi:hypothetical protein ABFU82_06870 [Nocardioides sp. WV_118_6]|uniref:hypothetical protein n=1 Tax=Nocardioides simplex TaxID=2045 RepID=UPI00214F7F5E|nr:hypothetical protein [Pimelobacter simplex]UUW88124.1 hypothetical protein M0M43_20600 [Pimelobacter simplex]UUW97628.1 hypothetical protein M0M48_09245 [Pimelobacter simplex]